METRKQSVAPIDTPTVSILLPVKNSADTLEETLISVLTQEFQNFELICVVALSQDETLSIVQRWAATDLRIRVLLDLNSNGIAGQCNTGISEARGKYIAICHADDLYMPNRLGSQVGFLEKHPEVGAVGSDVLTFGTIIKYWRMPSQHEEIKATMLFRGAIANPSAMIRKSVLVENGIEYDETFHSAAEDLDLWVRLSRVTQLRNLNFPLVRYRIWDRQTTNVYAVLVAQNAARVRRRLLTELGVENFDKHIVLHESIARNEVNLNKDEVKDWFDEIFSRNKIYKVYDEEILRTILEREFFGIFMSSMNINSGRVFRFKWMASVLSKTPLGLKIKIARLIGL